MESAPVVGSLLMYAGDDDRDHLLARAVRRQFDAGELIIHEDDPTTHVHVVMDGWVRVFMTGAHGREVLIGLRGPGDVVGDLAALHGWTRLASVRTLGKVEVAQIRGPDFVDCLYARPGLAIALVKQMSVRLREAQHSRVDYVNLDVTRRVGAQLLQFVEQHGVARSDGVSVEVSLSQQDIADKIGASLRAVARAIALLRERHIVSTGRRRIVVERPDVLQAFVHSMPNGR